MRPRDPHGHWLDRWLTRPVGVLAWSTALLVAGIWAAHEIPLEWAPKIELPEITVTAAWPGASPRSVERYVTAPIERAAARVAGTERIESSSNEGMASVTVAVHESVDLGFYVAQLNEQLAVLRDQLPDRVSPRLTKRIPESLQDEVGFMQIQVVGPLPMDDLRELTERRIKPRLQSLQGLAEIEIQGGATRELLVELDPDLLETFGLGPDEVRRRVLELTGDDAYGRLRGAGSSVLLVRSAEERVESYRDLLIRTVPVSGAPLRLRDLGRIAIGPAPVRSISRIDGNPVVSMRIDRARGSHMVQVAEAVHDRLDEIQAEMPSDVRILIADDRSESVREQLHDLAWRGGMGLLLVILVLLFMLRSVRATLVVVFAVGVSIAVAFLLLGPSGLTLNLLTIAGLVLVFGLLVDNAVVVVEVMLARRGPGAAREALQTVWLPLVGGTLSTMIVMLPLVYLSGDLRELFLPFGVLVALTLAVSLAVAALVVPVLAQGLPRPEPHRGFGRKLRRMAAVPYRWAGRFPRSTLVVMLLVLGLPVWLVPTRFSFVDASGTDPDAPLMRLAALYNDVFDRSWIRSARERVDPLLGGMMRRFEREVSFGAAWHFGTRPEVSVSMGFPPGHPIARADSIMSVFEREALASASVERTILRISEESARLRVQFREGTLETAEPYLMRERLISHAVNTGGLRISVGGLLPEGYYSGSGGGISGISVEARGPNYADLDRLVNRFADYLRGRSRRVAGIDVNAQRYYGFAQSRQVLRFDWTAEAQARSGASAATIAGALSPIFRTRFPSAWVDLDEAVQTPIRIVLAGAEDVDVDRVISRPLSVSDSLDIRLAGLARYRVEERPSRIERIDQRYRRFVNIDFRGPPQMPNDFIDAALAGFAVPVGYELDRARYAFFTERVKEQYSWALWATILLVFIVTAAVFESWKLPVVVMLSVPTAGIGVAAGFLWTGANFAEGAFIGTILMIGIAVNDSILLVDRYRQLRELRPSTSRSVLARLAVRERLRPMFTTTLTSIVTMVPMLVFPDESDFWLGLAVTVIGGLSASTLLAPVVGVAALSVRDRPARMPWRAWAVRRARAAGGGSFPAGPPAGG
jgi:multidrug efflux pump subunit AcrB